MVLLAVIERLVSLTDTGTNTTTVVHAGPLPSPVMILVRAIT